MNQHSFFGYLSNRLTGSLPGRDAHMLMAPVPADGEPGYYPDDEERAYDSSVLILLLEEPSEPPEMILTLRTDTISHGGQISFPGGRSENHESLQETALREMNEEIGIPEDTVRIAGSLSRLYLHRSNNLITPFVGSTPSRPKLNINPVEVKEAFFVPLDNLLKRETLVRESWNLLHKQYDVPYWNIHNVPLWGATAMIISELLLLYKEYLGYR